MNRSPVRAAVFLVSSLVAAACGDGRPAPVSPSAVSQDAAAAQLKVAPPVPLAPADGAVVDDDDPELTIQNASPLHVDDLPLSYVFEVHDEAGNLVYRSGAVPAGPDGRTTHEVGKGLAFDAGFTWHAYAVYQGAAGPASTAAGFRTFNRYGASCAHLGSEFAIVECRRAQYGFMSAADRVEMLRRIAYDLNRASAEHAPYGILVKHTGSNCHGYSCDIICSNAGLHRQWDVLLDEDRAQIPLWNRLGAVAVRPCEALP